MEPERFDREPDGAIVVTVHQVAHDAKTGDLLSDARVTHHYRLARGRVLRMDVDDTSV